MAINPTASVRLGVCSADPLGFASLNRDRRRLSRKLPVPTLGVLVRRTKARDPLRRQPGFFSGPVRGAGQWYRERNPVMARTIPTSQHLRGKIDRLSLSATGERRRTHFDGHRVTVGELGAHAVQRGELKQIALWSTRR